MSSLYLEKVCELTWLVIATMCESTLNVDNVRLSCLLSYLPLKVTTDYTII